jgi:hypothetical protein
VFCNFQLVVSWKYFQPKFVCKYVLQNTELEYQLGIFPTYNQLKYHHCSHLLFKKSLINRVSNCSKIQRSWKSTLLYVSIKKKSEKNILRKVNLQLICSSNWAELFDFEYLKIMKIRRASKTQTRSSLEKTEFGFYLLFLFDLQIFKYSKSKRFFNFFVL